MKTCFVFRCTCRKIHSSAGNKESKCVCCSMMPLDYGREITTPEWNNFTASINCAYLCYPITTSLQNKWRTQFCSVPKTILTLHIPIWVQPCILPIMPHSAACVSDRLSQPLISPLLNARLNASAAQLPLLSPHCSMVSLFRVSALEVKIHARSI